MKRSPSLRELRRNCPANVVILPTAPDRQVPQKRDRAYGRAKRELIARQTVEFPFKWPGQREIERQEQSLELLAGVPPFDPRNPRHLRAWEALWYFSQRSVKTSDE